MLLTFVLTAMMVGAVPAAAHAPVGSTDVSASVTTDPADADVWVQLLQLGNDEDDICAAYSDAEEAYKADGSTGTFVIEPGVVLTISGDKNSGYTYSLTGGVMEDIFLKSSRTNNNWYHFEPGVRYASPLFTGTTAGLSHSIICWTPGAPSTDLDVTTPASGAITVYEGQTVNLAFTEKNDGDFTLTNVHLTTSDQACTNSLSPLSVTLDPGEQQTFTCSTSFTTADVYTIDAFGHGTYDGKDVTWCADPSTPPADTICDQDEKASVTITVLRPSTDLNLDSANSELSVVYGDDATLRFIEHNDSDDNTPLTNVYVEVVSGNCSPDPLTLVLKGADSAADDGDNVLDPGEKWAFECTVSNVTSSTTIKVVGHGTTPLGDDVTWTAECETGTPTGIICDTTEQAEATITVQTPSTDLDLQAGSVPGAPVPIGTSVTLLVDEANDGDVDLTSPSVSVMANGVAAGNATYVSGDDGDGILEVGETWTFSYVADTSVAGTTTYTFTGHGTDPLGRDVTYCGAGVNGPDGAGKFCDDDEQATAVVEVFEPGEGCTPGYWRNHHDAWAATGYSPSDSFNAVFGTDFSEDLTLGEAIEWNGGGLDAVVRHITAALLNAAHPDVDYEFTTAEVMQLWEDAQSDPEGVLAQIVPANEAGCPLD